jgi:hypothetical protein
MPGQVQAVKEACEFEVEYSMAREPVGLVVFTRLDAH